MKREPVDADRSDKDERINRSDVSVSVCVAGQRVMETIRLPHVEWLAPRVEWEDSAPERYFLFFADIEWCSACAGANQLLEMT